MTDGLVNSLARPGGNITGFSIISGVLAGKRLELLKETVPKLSRVAVLWDRRNSGSLEQWTAHQLSGKELGLHLHSMEVSSPDLLARAFDEAVKAHSDAFTVTQNPIATSRRHQVAELAAKHKLPAIYIEAEFAQKRRLDVLWCGSKMNPPGVSPFFLMIG